MTKNIVGLDGKAMNNPVTAPVAPKQPDPQTFEISLKDGKTFVESGYLALGAYVAILEKPNDAMSIKFASLPDRLEYVVRTDEVLED